MMNIEQKIKSGLHWKDIKAKRCLQDNEYLFIDIQCQF